MPDSFEKKQELYQEACAKTIEAIELYEKFIDLL
jgi:hypothetical protein